MKKALIIVPFLVLFIGAVSILRPVPIPDDSSDCHELIGEVITIGEGGEKDILFVVEGSSTRFYINRGLEMGIDFQEVYKKTVGQKVTFLYPDYWTPLDPKNKIRHVSKVILENGEVLYTEIKNEI